MDLGIDCSMGNILLVFLNGTNKLLKAHWFKKERRQLMKAFNTGISLDSLNMWHSYKHKKKCFSGLGS